MGYGAVLVGVVGVLGAAVLGLAYRLRTALGHLAALARNAERGRQWVEADAVRAAEEAVETAGGRVDDLAAVRARVRAMIARAEAVPGADAGPITTAA